MYSGASTLRDSIISRIHCEAHSGVQRTYLGINRRFFWKGMRKQIGDFCAKCLVCHRNKRASGTKEPLCPLKVPFQFPRAMVAYDIATLSWSDGFRYVLIMVDLFSKHMEAYPMHNQEAESIEMALEHGWCRRHGYPVIVLSDQGKNVDGAVFGNGVIEWV